MMPFGMQNLNAAKGIESAALNPKAGDIPTFADKTFSDVGSDVPRLEKDSNIPKFAEDNAESEYHANADEAVSPNENEDGISSAEKPIVDGSSQIDNAIARSCYINADGLPKI